MILALLGQSKRSSRFKSHQLFSPSGPGFDGTGHLSLIASTPDNYTADIRGTPDD
jgi:hypothetical protein